MKKVLNPLIFRDFQSFWEIKRAAPSSAAFLLLLSGVRRTLIPAELPSHALFRNRYQYSRILEKVNAFFENSVTIQK